MNEIPEEQEDGYRYYNKWIGGLLRKSKGDRNHCIAVTRERTQCTRNRGYGPNKDFCKKHAEMLEKEK